MSFEVLPFTPEDVAYVFSLHDAEEKKLFADENYTAPRIRSSKWILNKEEDCFFLKLHQNRENSQEQFLFCHRNAIIYLLKTSYCNYKITYLSKRINNLHDEIHLIKEAFRIGGNGADGNTSRKTLSAVDDANIIS